MIRGFGNADTERLWNGERVKRFASIDKAAFRKLDMLNVAARLDDLRSPRQPARSPEGRQAGAA
jgi:proteic killer suppression protein